ncbi:hypothetical protein AB0N29_09825 [Nocardioides sp. NPDC092400]|uniref:hypothetical protein n=1 Tax=Nocardioides sp. NPDC092400 TaxID=3155196 RepID=UPI003431A185
MTTTPDVPASTVLVAVDAGTRDHAGAEHVVHLLDGLLPAGDATYVASTHVVATDDGPHTAVAATWSGAAASGPHAAGELVGLLAAAVGERAGVLVVAAGDEAVAGPAAALAGARAAAGQHVDRAAGRLVRFAGRAEVERPCTVADVVALDAVDAVEALAGTDVRPETPLDLGEWARPTWRAGRSVLLVQPGRGGLVPFESRHQIACCADH